MKKHFNIKTITLFLFTFICVFSINSNVKAKDSILCRYAMQGDYSDYDVQFKYNNGSYSIGTYDRNNKKEYDNSAKNSEIDAFKAGKLNLYIANSSLNNVKSYDFNKNGCPERVYYLYTISGNGNINKATFYINDEEIKKNGYGNNSDLYGCSLTGDCGISPIDSLNSTNLPNNNISTSDLISCRYANIYSASNGDIEELFTLKYNSNTVIIEKAENSNLGEVYPTFKASDLNGSCPNVLYLGGGSQTPVSLKTNSYVAKAGLIVNFSKDSLTNPDSTVENQICNGSTMKIISTLYNIIKFLIPIIIIVFSIIDFMSVVLSGENEKMEKAKKRFITRIIVGLALLFVPSIIELLLRLSGILGKGETLADITCNILS